MRIPTDDGAGGAARDTASHRDHDRLPPHEAGPAPPTNGSNHASHHHHSHSHNHHPSGLSHRFHEAAPAGNTSNASLAPHPAQDRARRSVDESDDGGKPRAKSKGRRPSGQQKICGKCQQPLMGQFVRALGDTYHLECFTCHDCDKIVASKFFPVPDQPPNQYPLCEVDYFRRLDLLCQACGGALRGSYITALDKKYHIEHFTCSVCPTVFGAQDSYYEHEGSVYCHYHYSTNFAQRCNGCQTAILKQFVEIFRNGVNQHWHPECYMIHKYWNVRLHAPPPRGSEAEERELERQHKAKIIGAGGGGAGTTADASEDERRHVRTEEEAVEYKVHWIWQTLSTFEERSATCISDMLLHVSNGAYMDGVVAAKKFIIHVDLLFSAADQLDRRLQTRAPPKPPPDGGDVVPAGLSYSREAKLLCKKVVAFFALLTENQDNGVRRLGVTQELLSLVTGLAHYLKLMIRICLSGALKLERETASATGLEGFLEEISQLDDRLDADGSGSHYADAARLDAAFVDKAADTCAGCGKAVEDRCFRHPEHGLLLHTACLACAKCGRDFAAEEPPAAARWSEQTQRVWCEAHAPPDARPAGFVPVTRLQQYVHLLRVAHARLLATLRTGGALPHTSDDPNLGGYDSREGHAIDEDGGAPGSHPMRASTRSRSYAGRSGGGRGPDESGYEDTMGDIRRLRSTRMEKQLSNATRKARTSRIIDGPEAMRPGSAGGDGAPGDPQQPSRAAAGAGGRRRTGTFQIVEDRDAHGETTTNLTFGTQDTMTLDDIPRIVQAQQTKEQRPNASRYARNPVGPQEPRARLVNGHTREASGDVGRLLAGAGGPAATAGGPGGVDVAGLMRPAKKYFSELTALEYFIIRHLAVLAMEPLLTGYFNQEELIDLIEAKRPTFWSKFGKAFGTANGKGKDKKGGKANRNAVFGVPLEQLLERDYEESTDGVGPGSLKIPSLVQEAVSAMRTMDMSVEGVFRKNGNIKRLNEVKEEIDAKGTVEVDLTKENPVQVAALLKKFLRELPDPLLTHKLHKLWITSQRIDDNERRRRVLHLTCCLLPKPHRDTVEILFTFMQWVSSFSHVDEESGSKMDIHNLATVITPNIIHRGKEHMPVDESFLAIEAVHSLIECNESMCEIPEDLALMMNDSALFNNTPDITTKEILKRYNDYVKDPKPRYHGGYPQQFGPSGPSGPGGGPGGGGGTFNPDRSSGSGGGGHSSSPIPVAGVTTRVEADPTVHHAWQNESSVRHVGSSSNAAGGLDSAAHTPPQAPYLHPGRNGSTESGGGGGGGQYGPGHARSHSQGAGGNEGSAERSPNRASVRNGTFDKQRAMGMT